MKLNKNIQKKIEKLKYLKLKEVWGYSEFRGKQEEAIDSVLGLNKDGIMKDTFVQLPTGIGKTICFQLPSLLFKGATIIISPFISLQKDQVSKFDNSKLEEKIEFINSSLENKEKARIISNLKAGKLKMIYISPERFVMSSFQEILKKINISIIAIDEAHLVDSGENFRQEFGQIGKYIKIIKKNQQNPIVTIALTATATNETRKNIIESLYMKNTKTVKMSYIRENLNYFIKECSGKKKKEKMLIEICHIFKKIKGTKLIYGTSKNGVKHISDTLKLNGFKSDYYHAGRTIKQKEAAAKKFNNNKIEYLIATSAFGTGIDKPNIHLIINDGLTFDLLEYSQMSGRGGRDGGKTICILLWTKQDIGQKRFMIGNDWKMKEDFNNFLEIVETTNNLKSTIKDYFDN